MTVWPSAWKYWKNTTVPRTAATAFGVRMTTSSPGRISCFATLTNMAPEDNSMVDRVAPVGSSSSRTSRRDSSRSVTVLLPPNRTRTRDFSWVSMVSRIRTPSLKRRATGPGAAGRLNCALP